MDAKHLQYIANKALTEPPEFEKVEVVRWMCAECDELFNTDVFNKNIDCGAELNARGKRCESRNYIKLTGIVTRPKPPKVKRSMTFGDWRNTVIQIPDNAIISWEE
jgi:hypothetical protein